MFPDTRQYLRCYPVFKAFSRFKFAAEDERVETGFVNNSYTPFLTCTVDLADQLILCLHMLFQCSECVTIFQRRCYIFSYEPWLSIFLNTAQISKFWMIEGLTLRSGRRRGSRSCGWCIPSLLAICTCLYFI